MLYEKRNCTYLENNGGKLHLIVGMTEDDVKNDEINTVIKNTAYSNPKFKNDHYDSSSKSFENSHLYMYRYNENGESKSIKCADSIDGFRECSAFCNVYYDYNLKQHVTISTSYQIGILGYDFKIIDGKTKPESINASNIQEILSMNPCPIKIERTYSFASIKDGVYFDNETKTVHVIFEDGTEYVEDESMLNIENSIYNKVYNNNQFQSEIKEAELFNDDEYWRNECKNKRGGAKAVPGTESYESIFVEKVHEYDENGDIVLKENTYTLSTSEQVYFVNAVYITPADEAIINAKEETNGNLHYVLMHKVLELKTYTILGLVSHHTMLAH